jgi:hypothetical protein
MKKSLFWSCASVMLLAASPALAQTATPNAQQGWVNALKPKGRPGPELALAQGGKTDYVISIPAQPTTQELKAASILSWWLKEMTGATFPTVREGAGTKAPAKVISIGKTALLNASGLAEAKLDLGEEGYAIAAKGSNLFLLGGTVRGPIYAAYSLLEEDLGCRWYALTKSSDRIPRVPTLKFKPSLRHFVPVLSLRDPYYKDAFNAEWSLRNKTNAPQAPVQEEAGGYARHALFVHTYNILVPPSQYFETHPEYYAEVDGKRQATQLDLSNPDVFRITVENVKKYLRETPGSKFISVSPNDGRGYCECPICSALDKSEATTPGSKSASLIKFVNEVAAAIEPEFPNVKVSTLAYLDTFLPPKTIRPRKNVVIQLCTDSHAWKYPFCFVDESQTFQNAMKAWNAIGADMYIWDYITDYPHHMLPYPNMNIVQHNIKFYMDHGAKGVMLQGNESLGSENGPLRSWVWAKQLWDPSLDTKTLMRDFIYGYYGTAAEPIWKYNMMLWNIWEENHKKPHDLTKSGFNNILILEPAAPFMPDNPMYSKEFLDTSTKFFDEAEALAKDPETLQRVRVAKLSIIYTKLGQALGFYPEFGAFQPGPWTKQPDLTLQPYYRSMLKEFIETTNKAGVVNISERQEVEKIIDNWTKMVERDWLQLPVLPLSNQWKFKTDPENVGVAENWAAPQTDATKWADVYSNRRNGWEAQGFPDYKGVTWYRQNIRIPADFKPKHLYLLFGAVDSEAEVFINGVKAFDHTIAATGLPIEVIWNDSFAFDPTPWLKLGEENTIAVRVQSAGGIRGIWQPGYLVSSDKELTVPQLVSSVTPYG